MSDERGAVVERSARRRRSARDDARSCKAERARARRASPSELALLRSEERLSLVLAASSEGLWDWDLESGQVSWSDRTFALLGHDRASFGGTLAGCRALVHPDDHELFDRTVREHLEGGELHEIELRIRRGGGEYGIYRCRGQVLRGADGRPLRIAGSIADVTERRIAETELQKSEQRFRAYFEQSIVGLAISSPDKGLCEINDHFCKQLGYSREELLKKNWVELTHPDDLAADLAQFKRVLAHMIDSYTVDKRFIRKDGSVLHAEISVSCVRRADGSVDYLLGLLHDVSERVRAERALHESSELFAKTFHEIPDSLMVSDLTTGELLDVNQGFERMLGWSRAEAIGKSAAQLGFIRDEVRSELIRRALHDGGCLREVRVEIVTRGGERRAALLSSTMVEIGGRTRAIVVLRDVSEQERAHRALRESEDRFVKAFQSSPNAIAISELDSGRLLEVNDSYVRLAGTPREQLIGRSAAELGLWRGVDQKSMRQQLREEGSLREIEVTTMNARGESLVGLVSADIIETEGRRCMIVTAQDVTERRRIEAAKAQLESALRHAQKMEAIGTLAGGIAHDFNNILGAILAFTELARMDALNNAAALESLHEVRKAGERAKELVRQILTFSRRQPPERRSVHLQPVVNEVLQLVRSTLPASVAILAQIDARANCVEADVSLIHQVLLNLCTNAAQALGGRAGRLTVELVPCALDGEQALLRGVAPGEYVRLSVHDSGCGIDADTQKRIFEPFFTTKAPGEGTGLGLSVVHGIVQDHQGVIWVESALGRGSSFHVLLPICASPEVANVREPEDMPLGKGERILFVDDESLLCRSGKRLLERLNYAVVAETSARAALEQFRAAPDRFDLVVTDLTMPELTGVELAAEIVKIRPGVPIVLVTGFSAGLEADAIEALGVRQLAMKPLSAAALARTLRAALRRETQRPGSMFPK